jgi:hypothetical protein
MEPQHPDQTLGVTPPEKEGALADASFPPRRGASPLENLSPQVTLVERSDLQRGVVVASFAECGSFAPLLRAPHFQVLCLGDSARELRLHHEAARVGEAIALQLHLRVEHFVGTISADEPTEQRVAPILRRSLVASRDFIRLLCSRIDRFVDGFAALTGATGLALTIVSERGPRRLELERGPGSTTFHVDASAARVVAPLLGPQTIFLLGREAESHFAAKVRRSGYGAPEISGPFDFDTLVQAAYRQTIRAAGEGTDSLIHRAPDGFGIVFYGSTARTSHPLVHSAPQPRDGIEALQWARLFFTLDLSR